MTRADFAAHLLDLLRYWEHARDPRGGFHTWRKPDGAIASRSHQSLVMQSRLLYNYAEGQHCGHAFCAPIAEAQYQFVRERMRVPDGWYASLHEDALLTPATLDSYANLFVVIGLARYARAARRADVLEEAERLLQLIEARTIAGDFSRDGMVSWSGAGRPRWGGPSQHSADTILHYLEALVCLRDAGTHLDVDARAAATRMLFMDRIFDADRLLVHGGFDGGFNRPEMGPGVAKSLGHGLEWIDFFRCFPALALDESVERGLLEKALTHGVGADGHFMNDYYVHECRTAGPGVFWPHVEAIKTLNLAYSVYGAPYDHYFRLLARYYFDHYVDSNGGVFSEIDRNGVVTNRWKGSMWKCDYHSVRMCLDVMERPGGVLPA